MSGWGYMNLTWCLPWQTRYRQTYSYHITGYGLSWFQNKCLYLLLFNKPKICGLVVRMLYDHDTESLMCQNFLHSVRFPTTCSQTLTARKWKLSTWQTPYEWIAKSFQLLGLQNLLTALCSVQCIDTMKKQFMSEPSTSEVNVVTVIDC